MKVDVFFTAGSAEGASLAGATAVVIDVIRATSTIIEALANGARAIYPTVSTEEAIRLASSLGRDDTLLCGERKGLKVEGFDLGNSPLEYTPPRVRDKRLVMSTTNGTRAFAAAAGADRVLAASYLNLSAAARAVASAETLVLVCAGKEDRFSLDDAVCAGLLLARARELGPPGEPELNDAARAALDLARSHRPDRDFLAGTAAGRALLQVGLGDDLPFCAQQDRHDVVPEMEDRMIRLPHGAG